MAQQRHLIQLVFILCFIGTFISAFLNDNLATSSLRLRKNSNVFKYLSLSSLDTNQETPTFRQLYSKSIPKWLLDRCESVGFVSPTLVQELTLPVIFEGKDVVLQAQTGSGKTLAFSLPILSKIDATRAAIQAVIIVPTRELGLQISGVLRQLASAAPEKILIMSLMDGSQNRRQQIWAVAEPPHIIVCNPKSLQRLVDNGRLKLGAVSYLVLDEVDASLINSDSRRDIHNLLSRKLSSTFQTESDSQLLTTMQENSVYKDHTKDQRDINMLKDQYNIRRQTIMCSATIPQRQHFASQCKQNSWTDTVPELIHVSSKDLMPKQIVHEYIECDENLRLPWLSQVKNININDKEDKDTVNSLKENILFLSEDLNLDDRADAIGVMRESSSSILVCTDVAARGIDLPAVSLVLQLNLPDKVDNYLHRSGRAGRLGRPGRVVTMTSTEEAFVVQRYGNELGINMNKRVLKLKPAT
eukprot:gene2173-4224_t